MTEGTSTSGAPAAAETAVPVAVATAAAPTPAPVEAQAAAAAAAVFAAPSAPAPKAEVRAIGPAAAALAAIEAAAAVEAAAAKKAEAAEKADKDSDETSMSDADLAPEVELASLGEAGAAVAGQDGLPCGVLPVVDAPVVSGPVEVPVGDTGFALSPALLGLLGLGALGLGYLLLRDDDDNDDDDGEEPVDENEAPVAADETIAADEDDTAVTGQLDATDADGDDLTFELDDDVPGLTVDEDGSYTFDATAAGLDNLAEGETETITATYTVTDEDGATDTGTITITVTGVNEAPVITSGATATIDENVAAGTEVYDANATDADGDTITYSLSGADAAAFTIDAETGEVFFVGSPDFETQATYNITVTATDEHGATDTQDVVISVNDLDEGGPVVFLDLVDDDGNPNTVNVETAAGADFTFVEDDDAASLTRITGFAEGDVLLFEEGSIVSFSTSADDANDLQIIVNNGGVVSEVILDDVLPDGAGLIFNEATAEAEVGFDFFSQGPTPTPPAAAVAIVEDNFA